MTTSLIGHVVDPGPDGVCVVIGCGRPVAVVDGRPQHKRGRRPGVVYGDEARIRAAGTAATIAAAERRRARRAGGAARAAQIRDTDFDGPTCECGVDLAVHPPLRPAKPIGGWESAIAMGQPWRNTVTGKAKAHKPNANQQAFKIRAKPSPAAKLFSLGRGEPSWRRPA